MNSEEKSSQLFDNLLFPKILQTFRMAIQPSKLTIAFSALAVICLAGWLMDICTKTVITTQNKQGQITNSELQVYMSNPDNVRSYIKSFKQDSKGITVKREGVFSTLWNFAAKKFQGAVDSLFAFDIPGVVANIADYFRATGWAFRYHPTYCIIFGIIKLAVIALVGGAICRLAALQLARGEKPGLTEAMRFGTKKFTSLFTAPLVPVIIIIAAGILISLWGLLGNIPFIGELIIGISTPLTLLAGAVIAATLIGTVAGFNLMFPAVAYDGSDCFDAISRSFNYIYARPWRMGFYTATAAVYGAICYTFVRFFAFLMLLTGRWFLQLGIWEKNSQNINKLVAIWPQPTFRDLVDQSALAATNWSAQSTAALLIYLTILVIIGLLVAFIISFYFSANTIIYALLRNKVDQTNLDEIYTPSAAETKSEDNK